MAFKGSVDAYFLPILKSSLSYEAGIVFICAVCGSDPQ